MAETANAVSITPSKGDPDGAKFKEYQTMYDYSIQNPEAFFAKEAIVRAISCLSAPCCLRLVRIICGYTRFYVALMSRSLGAGAPVVDPAFRQSESWNSGRREYAMVHGRTAKRMLQRV
jgi:hypothetical protein